MISWLYTLATQILKQINHFGWKMLQKEKTLLSKIIWKSNLLCSMIDWLYMLIDVPANENMYEYFKFNEGFAYTMYSLQKCTSLENTYNYFAKSELTETVMWECNKYTHILHPSFKIWSYLRTNVLIDRSTLYTKWMEHQRNH